MKKFWQRLVLFGLTGAFFVSCISCSAANKDTFFHKQGS